MEVAVHTSNDLSLSGVRETFMVVPERMSSSNSTCENTIGMNMVQNKEAKQTTDLSGSWTRLPSIVKWGCRTLAVT
jgi:hypothetical protein